MHLDFAFAGLHCHRILCLDYILYLQPTLPSEGKEPPRIGNMGHITRIANKLIQLANSSSMIQNHLQVIQVSVSSSAQHFETVVCVMYSFAFMKFTSTGEQRVV
jgi:hypothetical protein